MAQLFPRAANQIAKASVVLAAVGAALAAVLLMVVIPRSSWVTRQHEAREQPVPFYHKHHVAGMGIDCRYCHTQVEVSPHANLPGVQTCMNCHKLIGRESKLLAPVRDAWENKIPIPWVRVHNLPDYVYFNHAAHLRGGVGCISCHGHVQLMDTVAVVKPLSMGWCLDCHRNPEPNLRPPEEVTNMYWQLPANQAQWAAQFRREKQINPPVDCSGCHR